MSEKKAVCRRYLGDHMARMLNSPEEAGAPSTASHPRVSQQELLCAAKWGDVATVATALRDPHIDPNVTDAFGITPLIGASRSGKFSVVKVLIADDRTNPNIATRRGGWTALIIAVRDGFTNIASLLLANDRVDPTIETGNRETAMHFAAKRNDTSMLEAMLLDKRVNPNTILYTTAKNGPASLMALLLRNDRVDPTMPGPDDGKSALILASEKGQASVVRVLLADKRVDPNFTNKHISRLIGDEQKYSQVRCTYGNTALMLAASFGHASVMKRLLADERVDPNLVNPCGFTALIYAARYKEFHTVRTMMMMLLADLRTKRSRPTGDTWYGGTYDVSLYDSALSEVEILERGLSRFSTTMHTFTATVLFAAKNAPSPMSDSLLCDNSACVLSKLRPSSQLPAATSIQIKQLIATYAGLRHGNEWRGLASKAAEIGMLS